MTGGKQRIVDLGWNYTWPSVMVGVVAHLIVFIIGWLASFLFPAETNLKKEWTLWGWLERRAMLKSVALNPHPNPLPEYRARE